MKVYSVSELTTEIKELLESGFLGVWVEGEVTNYRGSPSGHLYFSLKDEFALLNCVMWKENRTITTVELKNGKKVRVYGLLRVYAKGGSYNLQVEKVEAVGIGELQIKFEELKRKLKAEGLFDLSHKRPLPAWVERIGVVTALDGAAIQDIIKVVKRRYPGIEIIVRSSPVQGDGAAQEIANGIKEFNQFNVGVPLKSASLLIIGRGGGSIEDLWAFNEEVVARAIYNSKIPVISAVGHDIDWTIADFVADCRAPTPSAAAEIAVKDSKELLEDLTVIEDRLRNGLTKKIIELKDKLRLIEKSYGIKRFIDLIHQRSQTLDELQYKLNNYFTYPLRQNKVKFDFLVQRFNQEVKHFIGQEEQKLQEIDLRLKAGMSGFLKDEGRKIKILESKLLGLNPRATLERGYSICYKVPEKKIIKTSKMLVPKDKVEIEFFDGKTECEVKKVLC